MTQFPIKVCLYCPEINIDDDHEKNCSKIFKCEKFTPSNQWVSVNEKLPEKYTRVLLFNINTYNDNRAGIHAGFIDNNKRWLSSVWTSLSISSDKVTHWMPLPELPK